jgi:hypothetical protein
LGRVSQWLAEHGQRVYPMDGDLAPLVNWSKHQQRPLGH